MVEKKPEVSGVLMGFGPGLSSLLTFSGFLEEKKIFTGHKALSLYFHVKNRFIKLTFQSHLFPGIYPEELDNHLPF